MNLRALPRFAAVVAFGALSLGASCGQSALGIMPGVVNDPQNLSLRRSIFSYATSRMCSEMQKRSIPLRLNEADPTVGRFYPSACFAQQLENQNLFLQFSGQGYAWSNMTKRVGFEASGAIEYDHDFLLQGSTMYIYFRRRSTSAVQFTPILIEQQTASALGGLASVGAPGQTNAAAIGKDLMETELARGFTVIRDDDGTVAFSLGLLPPGTRPDAPFRVESGAKMVQANERTEVHQNQRDYAGPFEVMGGDSALYLTAQLDGAPAVDVIVVAKSVGDPWIQSFVRDLTLTPPLASPILDEPIQAGILYKRMIRVPPGLYYIVFDNTSAAGSTMPSAQAYDDRAALLRFAVEMGEAP